MDTDLTRSTVHRQNILNNPYALEHIQDAIQIGGIAFEGKRVVFKQQAARFFEVTTRTIESHLKKHEQELRENGYEVLDGKRLILFKLACKNAEDPEIDFGILENSYRLGVFDFRAFLNLAMLLRSSERAAILRSAILDIAIDAVNARTGGGTKYINQRDEGFLRSLYNSDNYRSRFTDALKNFVNLGNIKYPIYTNKIYNSIFREDADEYRRILKLSNKEKVRSTFYTEIMDLVAAYENGFAEELQNEFLKIGRKLTAWEADAVFSTFESAALWRPLIDSARAKMASRDLAFRDSLHIQLQEYVSPLNRLDFERFLGEKSQELEVQLREAKEILERLKERD